MGFFTECIDLLDRAIKAKRFIRLDGLIARTIRPTLIKDYLLDGSLLTVRPNLVLPTAVKTGGRGIAYITAVREDGLLSGDYLYSADLEKFTLWPCGDPVYQEHLFLKHYVRLRNTLKQAVRDGGELYDYKSNVGLHLDKRYTVKINFIRESERHGNLVKTKSGTLSHRLIGADVVDTMSHDFNGLTQSEHGVFVRFADNDTVSLDELKKLFCWADGSTIQGSL